MGEFDSLSKAREVADGLKLSKDKIYGNDVKK